MAIPRALPSVAKEVGVWGLVPTNNKKSKKYFDKLQFFLIYISDYILLIFFIVLFPPQKEPKSANVFTINIRNI